MTGLGHFTHEAKQMFLSAQGLCNLKPVNIPTWMWERFTKPNPYLRYWQFVAVEDGVSGFFPSGVAHDPVDGPSAMGMGTYLIGISELQKKKKTKD